MRSVITVTVYGAPLETQRNVADTLETQRNVAIYAGCQVPTVPGTNITVAHDIVPMDARILLNSLWMAETMISGRRRRRLPARLGGRFLSYFFVVFFYSSSVPCCFLGDGNDTVRYESCAHRLTRLWMGIECGIRSISELLDRHVWNNRVSSTPLRYVCHIISLQTVVWCQRPRMRLFDCSDYKKQIPMV